MSTETHPNQAPASEWQPIESAPRDGTEVVLTWMDQGEPQDIARMRWNPAATNFLFPGIVGMWDAGSFTWTEHNLGAPTHWKPVEPSSPSVDARVAGADMSGNAQTNGSDPAENACPAGFEKLDDHGRGSFVIREGGFYLDRRRRIRGPIRINGNAILYPYVVEDIHGYTTFSKDGWFDSQTPSNEEDLIAPWIDWKAELLACLGHLSERDWFKDPDFHNPHVVCSLDADKVRAAVTQALATLEGAQ